MATLTTGAILVFLLVAVALALFVTEPVPIDVTALGLMVTLMVLRPWTGISPSEGVSGLSNAATVTILAMMILSDGVRRTGLIQRLQSIVAAYTGSSERRQLGATIGIVGPLSALINNTAAVAVLMPMVSDLAHENGTSPSKLLLSLSYASMFGGMLTLVGTSTNLLASSLAAEYLGRPFSMFEFTHLGAVVFLVGSAYLFTVGYWLTPAHVHPRSERETTDEEEYLTEVVVREESPAVGMTIAEAFEAFGFKAEIVQLLRDDEYYRDPTGSTTIHPGDVYTVRITDAELRALLDVNGVDLVPEAAAEGNLDALAPEQTLVEIVLTAGSDLVGETVDAATRLGVDAFSFVLAVTFAASTAFMSPVGYQTNLFVYGPGKYEFRDFVRVGGPLQLLLAVVTTAGITAFWGL